MSSQKVNGIKGRSWDMAMRRLPREESFEVRDAERRARTVLRMLRGIIPLALLSSSAFFGMIGDTLPGAILLGLSAALGGVYFLLRSRRLNLAIAGLGTIFMVSLLAQPLLTGDLGAVPFFASAAAVAMTFLLPMRLMWTVPLGLIAVFALLFLISDPRSFEPLPWGRTFWDGAFLSAIVTVMVAAGSRGLSDLGLALDRSRQQAQRLAGELELRVQARTKDLEEALSDKEALLREVQDLAIRDALTGLHNRRYWDEMSPVFLARAARGPNPVSLAIMDVDQFRTFNTMWDYEMGDEVLRRIAQAIRKSARASDVLVRLGGDEFLLLMPDTSTEEALNACQRIRENVAEVQWRSLDSKMDVTISIGLASTATALADDLKSAANKALKLAKRQGRNQVQVAA